jgi:hypothetical protein
VARTTRIWDPATSEWSDGPTAAKMRLYHSTSLLLPDGRVFTGGGGAPGPQTNLNAEIYTPPYLYKQDGSGALAPRPHILSAPNLATWGQEITLLTDVEKVSRVTMLKMGSATHTVDFDQRFMPLHFQSLGPVVFATLPASANLAPPGYYMVFVFNEAGVPSEARIVKLSK